MRKSSSTPKTAGDKTATDPTKINSNPFAASADMFRQYQTSGSVPAFGSSGKSSKEGTADWAKLQAPELVQQMDEFVELVQLDEKRNSSSSHPADDALFADRQLQAARKLRQLLPSNKELLYLAQERNWIPLLLGWLNLHDRPAVQVEALLTLTNMAELCAQQSYYSQGGPAAAAAAAAVKAAGNKLPPDSSFYSSGNVPFPPLSFSQPMTAEAMAEFDASLSSSIKQTKGSKNGNTNTSDINNSKSLSTSNSFSSSSVSSSFFASALAATAGASTSFSSNPHVPPPTPVSGGVSDGFPQQLSASSQYLLLRHADAIPTLIELLSSPQRDVYEQAMWILGSVAAGDSTTGMGSGSSSDKMQIPARDVVLAAGIMTPLLDCLQEHTSNLSLQRMGSWTLSNLVEGIFQQAPGKGSRNLDYVSSDDINMTELLPVLRRLLGMADAEVLSYSCWTLSHLCDGPSSHISAIVSSKDKKVPRGGIVPRLVELLLHPSWRVTKPALRTIGNIVCAECSDDEKHSASSPTDYTEIILDCGAVPHLKELVVHSNRDIQKEACWTLSNIAAGTVDQIQAVLDSGAIPPLVKLVSGKDTDQEVRSEACWVVLNATSCGSNSQIEVLVEEGCVEVLGVLLGEQSMVMMALEGLERVLQVEEAREDERRAEIEKGHQDPFPSRTLVKSSLISKALEKHNSGTVTKRASRIWKQHFVSCALCNKSFSKHRTADATFCDECKCYVCSKCDCRVYHLSYQEELWAESEPKPESKKGKSKKKKKKKKGTAAKQQPLVPTEEHPSPAKEGSTVRSLMSSDGSESNKSHSNIVGSKSDTDEKLIAESAQSNKPPVTDETLDFGDDDVDIPDSANQEVSQDGEQVDFVLYLQQTGSIIALAKLMDAMDALDYGDDSGYDDTDFDATELEMLRHHKIARSQQQATN